MAKRGAPSTYSPEMAEEVCRLIAEGKSLRAIGAIEGMPAMSTVIKWLNAHEEFVAQYARARELQMERFAEEILEIADDNTADVERDEAGNERVNTEHIQRSRLRVDSRKWLMSKLAPKKYGDRAENLNINVTPDGDLAGKSRDDLVDEARRIAKELAADKPKKPTTQH